MSMLLLRCLAILTGARLLFYGSASSVATECKTTGENDVDLPELSLLQVISQLETAVRSAPTVLSADQLGGASLRVRSGKGGGGSGQGGRKLDTRTIAGDVPADDQTAVEKRFRRIETFAAQSMTPLRTSIAVALAIPALAGLAALVSWFFRRGEAYDSLERKQSGPEYEAVNDDSYSCMVCSMVRDSHKIASGNFSLLRPARIVTSISMVVLQMGIQFYILRQIFDHVIAKVVPELQASYDEYEVQMYSSTYVTPGGFHRGHPKDFLPLNFLNLPAELTDVICEIPLAHDSFFIMVLFVWTLSCTVDMRECYMMFTQLVLQTPTVPTIGDTTREEGDKVLIVGLTTFMKALIVIVVTVPRIALDVILLGLGARWLTATADFAEVILNTVALEFLMMLRKLFFYSLVPHANQVAMKRTYARMAETTMGPVQVFCAKFVWAYAAFGFVISYIYFWQDVLPYYGWDVEEACTAAGKI
eukprot:gb/GFBE01004601.1/.p1 GENE.gb/GFBE01004601.1/~~gb/GFBE01004601.1/.p1  ORF type:complete len:475 (+),score=65.89 gb/GFBE01004601.1/:1-1425(+)